MNGFGAFSVIPAHQPQPQSRLTLFRPLVSETALAADDVVAPLARFQLCTHTSPAD